MSDLPYKTSDPFGTRVRKMRRYLDMSQEKLALKMETSRSHISKLEHNEHAPTLETVKKAAKAFDMSIDELVKGL
jgi:transcriptional regulator with XRE-family HTH domain